MQMIANLHSLLSSKWFIEEKYGFSLMPSLVSILNGNEITIQPSTETENSIPELFITYKAGTVNADNFNDSTNDNEYVLVVSVKNPIYKYNQECGPRGTKSKIRQMKSYENDPNCKGVVLDIDSGGGQVSGTPEFHDVVLNYSKPVVAYTDGLMCSAAYYIGSAAQHIIANKRADAIGSIGTMIHFIDFSGYYEKHGAKVITEYATKSTEKNKDFEELLKGNPEGYIKNELDPITETFHDDVKAARKNLKEEVLKGGTYSASVSLENGLVDEIGTLQTAIDKVFELSNSNTNTNNNSNKNMSKKEFKAPSIQGVLGYDEPFQSNSEEGIFLQEAELDQVETALTSANSNLSDANTALDSANTTISDADATIDAALENAEIEALENATLNEKITLLNNQRNEFAKRTPNKSTNVGSDGDADPDVEGKKVVYAHNTEAENILNN